MQAAYTQAYGGPEVLSICEVPQPTLGEHEILVQVLAAPVTAADLRLRSADFPAITAAPGRLMFGITRPRVPVQGTAFAGRVVGVGARVTRFAVGDDVFGGAAHGAYAEYLSAAEDGPIAKVPQGITHAEAAAVPYGGVTALRFLRDIGQVRSGDRVLIVGASGGVGRFAVQLAKHLGAEVTAVCSRDNAKLVRELGADHVIAHEDQHFTNNGQQYDVVFDIADATSFQQSRASLTPAGRYLTLFASLRVLLQVLLTSLRGGQRAKFSVAMSDREDMQQLADLLERRVIWPVLGERYALRHIADAHTEAKLRSNACVVVTPSTLSVRPTPQNRAALTTPPASSPPRSAQRSATRGLAAIAWA